MTAETMFLFAEDENHAARLDAIDQLHSSTALYTSSPIVSDLLSRVKWPAPGRKLADVSAGDGQFLSQALTKLLDSGVKSDQDLLDCLEGYEIHEFACAQARARLTDILVGAGRDRASASNLAEKMVHNKDFLTQGPTEPHFDTVIGNPPFLRRLNIPTLLRDEYDQCVPSFASGDMLHAFIDKVARVLLPGGEIAMVASDRWLASAGAAVLREKIGQRFSIRHLERLDPKSVFHRPKLRKAGTPPRISPIAIHLDEQPDGAPITKAAIYPGADDTPYAGLPTLGEVATVEMAAWLGPKGIFVLSAEEAARSAIPAEDLVPAFDVHDIVDGVLQPPSRFAIRTQADVTPCKAILDHLEATMDGMPERGRRGQMHVPPESFSQFNLDQPSLFIPRIARTPAAISVPAGWLPLNHNLRITCECPVKLAAIQSWLASDLAAKWLAERAPKLENEYRLILTKLLRKMPVDLTA